MDTITAVPGIKVGHAQDETALTGCTVILTGPEGATAGVDVRGGAPGSREIALLSPEKHVEKVHGILLTGGSAYGLAAADGVMQYLREREIGFETGVIPVPIVPAAVLFDLALGKPNWPDAAMGYQACTAASSGETKQGNVGAGLGASVGKIMGMQHAMKGGLGSSAVELSNGVIIGAIAAVNCGGDVKDPETNKLIAGAYHQDKSKFFDTMQVMRNRLAKQDFSGENTTLAVVATNAALSKSEAKKVAEMAQNGLAKTLWPAHTTFDGDTVFALSTGEFETDISLVGAQAAEVVAQAILQAVKTADSVADLLSYSDLDKS